MIDIHNKKGLGMLREEDSLYMQFLGKENSVTATILLLGCLDYTLFSDVRQPVLILGIGTLAAMYIAMCAIFRLKKITYNHLIALIVPGCVANVMSITNAGAMETLLFLKPIYGPVVVYMTAFCFAYYRRLSFALEIACLIGLVSVILLHATTNIVEYWQQIILTAKLAVSEKQRIWFSQQMTANLLDTLIYLPMILLMLISASWYSRYEKNRELYTKEWLHLDMSWTACIVGLVMEMLIMIQTAILPILGLEGFLPNAFIVNSIQRFATYMPALCGLSLCHYFLYAKLVHKKSSSRLYELAVFLLYIAFLMFRPLFLITGIIDKFFNARDRYHFKLSEQH